MVIKPIYFGLYEYPVKVWANTKLTVSSPESQTVRNHCEISELTGDQLTVSSLLPLHGALIGMISQTVHSKLTVLVANWRTTHHELVSIALNNPIITLWNVQISFERKILEIFSHLDTSSWRENLIPQEFAFSFCLFLGKTDLVNIIQKAATQCNSQQKIFNKLI